MLRSSLLTGAVGALGLAASAGADVNLNEIYASHAGTDNREFIELFGTPGMSLAGHALLVVEGEGAAAGTLDRVFDLSAASIPGDGYFVAGDDLVPNNDFSIGVSDRLENGTETFYLVTTTNMAGLTALLATDLDTNNDLVIFGPGGEQETLVTLVDRVGMLDPTGVDVIYDGSQVLGPDGANFPAGVFRSFDFPNAWSTTTFLNFNPDTIGTPDPTRPTPGGMNIPEPAGLTLMGLAGAMLIRRRV